VTAQVAWELAEASGGRFRLGLGTQVRAHIERRYGAPFDPPGPRLREYVHALRAIFRAFRGEEALRFDGDHYRLSLLPPMWSPGSLEVPDPPIDVAAVNPWMLRMAGEVADGVHVHPLNTPTYLRDTVLPNLAAGAARSGRDLADMAAVVADDLLAHFVTVGTWDGIAAAVVDRYQGVATRVVSYFSGIDAVQDPGPLDRRGDVALSVRATV